MEPDTSTAQENQARLGLFRRCFSFVRRFLLWFLLLALVIWSLGFYEFGRSTVYYENPGLAGQQQATELLKKVGQLIQLPPNETPSMATINDAASVKKAQPFLANAANGDVLIVYQTAQTALLYRPSENKLIAVGPVTSTAATQGQSAQKSPTISSPTPAASTTSNNGTAKTQ